MRPNWELYHDELNDKYYVEMDAEKLAEMTVVEIAKLQTTIKLQIRKSKREASLNPQ